MTPLDAATLPGPVKLVGALPPTRSQPARSITWEPHPADAGCPCSGTLGVARGKRTTGYALTEFPAAPGFAGRAFELVKGDGQVYHLLLADDRPHSFCDCAGSTYEASAKADRVHGDRFDTLGCVHLDAVRLLIDNRWLPHPGGSGE